jgi:hypothetical protein
MIMEKVLIHGAGSEMQGVGRLADGRAVFVPGALPGETVEIEILDHVDENNDGYCDDCDFQICDHKCHKGGFFWKLTLFFNKLFKLNKYCSCGVAHY